MKETVIISLFWKMVFLKRIKIGSKNGEITDNFLELPDELEGQKVDAVVFHVRAVNKEGMS